MQSLDFEFNFVDYERQIAMNAVNSKCFSQHLSFFGRDCLFFKRFKNLAQTFIFGNS